jgi:hypothetical protein
MLGFWIRNTQAAHALQLCANQMDIICFCNASEDSALTIYYFASSMDSFKAMCTTEKMIDEMIQNKCTSATLIIPEELDTNSIDVHFQKLLSTSLIGSRHNTLVVLKKDGCFLLFGWVDSVQSIVAAYDRLLPKLRVGRVQMNLQQYQVCQSTKLTSCSNRLD